LKLAMVLENFASERQRVRYKQRQSGRSGIDSTWCDCW